MMEIFTAAGLAAMFQVIAIDLVLAGDNAIVVGALAAGLPAEQRRKVILIGIGVSVVPGAGSALINNNMIAETPRGAVVGLDHARPVTSDLSAGGAQQYAQVTVSANAVRR